MEERVTKTVSLPAELVERVQDMADRDRRSFSGEVLYLLEQAIDAVERMEIVR